MVVVYCDQELTMALDLEWRDRIMRWREELGRHIEYKLNDVQFEYFVTNEQLSREQAMTDDFSPCPVGTEWGENSSLIPARHLYQYDQHGHEFQE